MKEVLGPQGKCTRGQAQGIDVPSPLYDSMRTHEHSETVMSACYHLFHRRTTLPCYRVFELPTVEPTTIGTKPVVGVATTERVCHTSMQNK